MLIKLATAAFEKASWPTTIQTGRYMYPLASNSRNVESSINGSSRTYRRKQRELEQLCKDLSQGSLGSSIAAASRM